MSQSEFDILNTFLISSSNLQNTATLSTFASFFPSSKRSHPDIATLYRMLQAQRTAICQTVRKNIQLECNLNATMMKGSLVNAGEALNEENAHIQELWQWNAGQPLALPEMLKQMEEAVDKMQQEMEQLGKGCDALLHNMKRTVNELSDGPFGKHVTNCVEETADGLKELIKTCEELLKNCEDA